MNNAQSPELCCTGDVSHAASLIVNVNVTVGHGRQWQAWEVDGISQERSTPRRHTSPSSPPALFDSAEGHDSRLPITTSTESDQRLEGACYRSGAHDSQHGEAWGWILSRRYQDRLNGGSWWEAAQVALSCEATAWPSVGHNHDESSGGLLMIGMAQWTGPKDGRLVGNFGLAI